MSAVFIHQSFTLSQKIDSREGWFRCQTGLVVSAGKMNIYSGKPLIVPIFGLFAAKCIAI